jgi:hypothetical protein
VDEADALGPPVAPDEIMAPGVSVDGGYPEVHVGAPGPARQGTGQIPAAESNVEQPVCSPVVSHARQEVAAVHTRPAGDDPVHIPKLPERAEEHVSISMVVFHTFRKPLGSF